ncbi:NACHT domain-containing protein [Micromonospora sp. DT233]|uniref:NACHT domain-containing protein n=1 Tax=Micromonospora sp. DT233 TaxID=3393432 RepID=UPI003CED3EF8
MFWRKSWGVVVSVAVALAVTAVVVGWSQAADGKPPTVVVLAVMAALLTAFVPSVGPMLRRHVSGDDVNLPDVASKLAVAVLGRLRCSPLRHRLYRPAPLRVSFRMSAEVSASRSAVFDVAGPDCPGWEVAPFDGDVMVVAERLRELPWRQLVVIGEPGAGKTVLASMLVDQLLSQSLPGEPVPVLLALSSWNPAQDSVAEFVARRLEEDFGLPLDATRRLASQPRIVDGDRAGWWVLPVLDGLDEIEETLQPAAVREIERFASADRGVVVTCRVQEFKRVVAAGGLLTRAAIVRLEPLSSENVIAFLSEPASRQSRWDPVFDVLRKQPSGNLAKALSTPLMAGLAKDTYGLRPGEENAGGDNDPAELTRLSAGGQIAARLIDGYVSAVYHTAGESSHLDRSISSADAARWLSNLAYLGYLNGSRDLRWWQLPWDELTPRPHRTLRRQLSGLAAAVVLVVSTALVGWLGWARALGTATVLAELLAAGYIGMFNQVFPHRFQRAIPRFAVARRWPIRWKFLRWLVSRRASDRGRRVLWHLLFGLLCSTGSAMVVDSLVALLAGVVCGGMASVVPVKDTRPITSGPASTLRANHLFALAVIARHGLIAAVVFAAAGALVGASPIRWAAAGAVLFAAGAFVGAEGSWLRFRINHVALSAKSGPGSILPRRLIAFLEDGTRPERVTLRASGTAWQFRHAAIQDHLLEIAQPQILRRRLDAGDLSVARPLTRLLRMRSDRDGLVAVLHRCAEAGDRWAADELVKLLREWGDVDELRRRADAGDFRAAEELARWLRERGDVDELRRLVQLGEDSATHHLMWLLRKRGDRDEELALLRRCAEAGDPWAASEMAERLRERGDVDELRRRAAASDDFAAEALAKLLRERGDVAELRRRADGGDHAAARELAEWLWVRDDLDGAVTVLRRPAAAGDHSAWRRLAELLRTRGDLEEAATLLRRLVDSGGHGAAVDLAQLLQERGDSDGAVTVLRQATDSGGGFPAAGALARLLRRRDDADELRRRANAGDDWAAAELAEWLHERGDVDELRGRTDSGDYSAAAFLAMLLRERGDVDELRRRADIGDYSAVLELAKFLRDHGDLDAAVAMLRLPADSGNFSAAEDLAVLLRERGDVDELRRRADAGDASAAKEFAVLLREQGEVEELHRRADAGDQAALYGIAVFLRDQGDVAELRRRADAGDYSAVRELAELLREQGDLDGAEAVLRPAADAGNDFFGWTLVDLLRERGDVDELRRRADAGDCFAAECLGGSMAWLTQR